MKRRKRPNHLISHMNVVPYIDVMLVLLIIFMVTAPMFVPGVINLPSVGQAAQISKPPLEINLDKNGSYSYTQNNKTTNATDLSSLVSQIQTIATSDTPIVISADKEVKYDSVINVIDQLNRHGIKKVALVVKEKNG